MNHILRNHSFRRFFSVLMVLLFLGTSFVYAADITVLVDSEEQNQGLSQLPNTVPRGTTVPMMYLRVEGENNSSTLDSIAITNNGSKVNFTNGISHIQVYQDSNNDFIFSEDSDTPIISPRAVTTGKNITISGLNESVPSGSVTGYFILYQLTEDAELEATTNIVINTVNGESIVSNSGQLSHTATVSGLKTFNVESVADSVVFPGETKVPMLYISVTPQGEDIKGDVEIKIENDSNNFVTNATSKNGVINAYLYLDKVKDRQFDPTNTSSYPKLKTITASTFTSASELTFTLTKDDLNFPADTSTNLFVVYDIGEDISVSSDATVQAQFKSFQGLGVTSELLHKKVESLPTDPAESNIGGLFYGNLTQISNGDSNFGSRVIAPILRFSLFASQSTVNIDAITITNPGNVPFVTSEEDEQGITGIQLFFDKNKNGVYDGEGFGDEKIGESTLGQTGSDGISIDNTSDEATISLSSGGNDYFSIAPYDSDKTYQQSNEARIFTVYQFGIDANGLVTASDSSTKAIARLGDATGESTKTNARTSLTETVDVSLSGNLPAAASPDAQITIQNTNVHLIDVIDISPTSCVQGQRFLPMLHVTVWGESQINAAIFSILNNGASFLPNEQGVSKVWIFRDTNNNQTIDVDDELIAANDSLPDGSEADLENVTIYRGFNYYIVAYDIGFEADTTQTNPIRAKLQDIRNAAGSTSVVLGGVVPAPKNSATCSVKSSRLSIPTITATDGAFSGGVSVNITIQNVSTESITVLDAFPKFYYSEKGGSDISPEFSVSLNSGSPTLPRSIAAGGTSTFKFDVFHQTQISKGNVIVDGYTEYIVEGSTSATNNKTAILTRYKTDQGFITAATTLGSFQVSGDTDVYDWDLPTYIQKIEIQNGSTTTTFANYEAIAPNSIMIITLRNKGSGIDESSIVNGIYLNGVKLTAETDFEYSRLTGVITILDTGLVDGALELKFKDAASGDSLTQATIRFKTSSSIQINDVLFYPNPYSPSSENLVLQFNLTQKAEVKIYLFNHLGQRVLYRRISEDETNIGYNTVEFTTFDNFVKSGLYVAKVFAKKDGKTKSVTTKLAIK